MFVVSTYSLAVIFCVITMLGWGSWTNTQKMAAKSWRFELFYWDYIIGLLLLGLLVAFTLGSMGTQGRSFIEDIKQASAGNIMNAMLGGALFNLANILLVAAIAMIGMALAVPLGVGLAMILGVIINYMSDPSKTPHPEILFVGLGLIAFAMLFDSLSYQQISKDSGKKANVKGLIITIAAGLVMSFFYYFVSKGMSAFTFTDGADGAKILNPLEPGKLTPYTAIFTFFAGAFLSNFIWNTYLMYKPVEGEPVTYGQYFKGSFKQHLAGVLGSLIWGIAFTTNLIAAPVAGSAISYGLGQGATLIVVIWGVFVWKEFKGAPKKSIIYLTLTFVTFLAGLACIVLAGMK
jgi:glucose uptake protein